LAIPGGGIAKALIVVAIYTVIQQLENNILVPRIMGSSLGLHPLSLTLGMIILGNMFGFWGVVFASPIVALLKSLAIALCKPDTEAADQAANAKQVSG
ncbi:AI-2E family transporter, partial [bacterium]|nr:AI-2E family transporter [bacterium]